MGAGPAEPALPALMTRFAEWLAVLARWVSTVRAYIRELDSSGRRSQGVRWQGARTMLEQAVREWVAFRETLPGAQPEPHPALAEEDVSSRAERPVRRAASRVPPETVLGAVPGPEALPGEESARFRLLMAIGDALEQASRKVGVAATAATDPAIRVDAATGMSRSYSEDLEERGLESSAAAARTRKAQARALRKATLVGAEFGARLDSAALAAAYSEAAVDGQAPHGGTATELYVSALLCSATRAATPAARGAALARLDAAKDEAFGLASDSSAAIAADAASLGEYHPLQAMCYAPGPTTGAPVEKGPRAGVPDPDPARALDITLPGTRKAVTYDLSRLIDRQSALEFGPLALTGTGLNYKLVERLRTIRAAPAHGPPADRPDVPAVWPPETPFFVTTDSGESSQGLARPEPWAPLAGCRHRELRLAMAAEEVILEAIRAEREAGWDPAQRERYEAAVQQDQVSTGECGGEGLAAALVAGLDRAYEATPPEAIEDFYLLALGHELDPMGVVCEAVSRHSWALLSDRLHVEMSAIGAPKVPYAALAQEAHLDVSVRAWDASWALWRRLRGHLRIDPGTFALPEPKRKLTLLRDFRRAAQQALQEAPLACAPMPLSYFTGARRPFRETRA